MKRLLCAVLALALGLCGCTAAQPGAAAEHAPALTAPQTEQQTLAVYFAGEAPAAAAALEAYADACGVTLTEAAFVEEAGLAVLTAAPGDDGWRDLSGDALLAAAAARAGLEGTVRALPLGKTLYGYWARSEVLTALFGEGFSLTDLQCATWAEWSDMVETLSAWIDAPQQAQVTLNGHSYTLPAQAEGETAGLTGVFALPDTVLGRYAGPSASSALVAAGWQRTEDALTGPLNGLGACYALENSAQAENGTVGAGATAVFYRGSLAELAATLPQEDQQSLVVTPQKIFLEQSDLSTEEYNLQGLMNYPVLTTAGYFAIPAEAGDAAAEAGAGFLLWLYADAAGETALTEELCLITPWNTASDATPLTARQVELVSTGVIPEAGLAETENAALAAAAAGAFTEDGFDGHAFTDAALAALCTTEN